MLVLVTYDVNVKTSAGRSRLRQVSKLCCNFGQRVQNSVFECDLDPAQLRAFKSELYDIIDPKTDSVRFYNLGKNYQSRVEHYGAKESYDSQGILMV